MGRITIAVHGAMGKMGREVIAAVCKDSELEVAGAVDLQATQNHLSLPGQAGDVPLSSNLGALLKACHPQVVVDFSVAEASLSAARIALSRGINLVAGTSGLTEDNLREIDRLSKDNSVGAVVAPNFALGAVVLVYLAGIAARFFDKAEIIELHHDEKADAPSGTAIATAREMSGGRGKPFVYSPTRKENVAGTRGGQIDGIAVHSVRLPGLMARQEVIFGAAGQTLTLQHDSISRECFMPGVILAIKQVVNHKGLVYGLDTLLHLRGRDERI